MRCHCKLQTREEDEAISRALTILDSRLRACPVLSTPENVKAFLRLQSDGLEHEVFAVMYLDAQSRLIDYERLFRGTLTQSRVYPREVVKQALSKNAAAVVLHHNHPSGASWPSRKDIELTLHLRDALSLIDVCLVDHVVTAAEGAFSMAEHRLLMEPSSPCGARFDACG